MQGTENVRKKSGRRIGEWWGILSHYLGNVLVYASFFFLIFCLINVNRYQDNPGEAYILGYRPVFVKTGSMEPTINVNGLLLVKQVEYEDVEVGDIILYESGEKTITHRVVDITEDGIQTKGDNNNTEDPYLLGPENVKARAVAIMNWTKYPMNDICPDGWGEGFSVMGLIKWIGCPLGFYLCIDILLDLLQKERAEKRRKKQAAEPVGDADRKAAAEPARITKAELLDDLDDEDELEALDEEKTETEASEAVPAPVRPTPEKKPAPAKEPEIDLLLEDLFVGEKPAPKQPSSARLTDTDLLDDLFGDTFEQQKPAASVPTPKAGSRAGERKNASQNKKGQSERNTGKPKNKKQGAGQKQAEKSGRKPARNSGTGNKKKNPQPQRPAKAKPVKKAEETLFMDLDDLLF